MHARTESGSPLRVLHVIPAIWDGSGGPSRAVIEMCRALDAAAPTSVSDIATTSHGLTPEWRKHVRARLPQRTTLHVFDESTWLDAGWSLSLARWLWSNVQQYDVVEVHALFNSTSSIAGRIARRRGVPYVVRPLGTLSPYTFAHRRRWLKRLYFRGVDAPMVRRAAAVHFTAPQEATKAHRRIRVGAAAVIPLPFESTTTAHPHGARGHEGRAASEVLFMARLHPVKGLDLLLQAIARLRTSGRDVDLVVAGSGAADYEREVREQVARLDLQPHVRFVGFVGGDEKRALLERADVFALPSRQENFGVAIVEALAAGVPVVVSREVDIWPDIERYGSGAVVATEVEPLSEALAALLTNADRRAACGAQGRRQVAELYSPLAVGTALHALYDRVSGRAGRDAPGGADREPLTAHVS